MSSSAHLSIQLKWAHLNSHNSTLNSTQLNQHNSLISTQPHSTQMRSSQLTLLNSTQLYSPYLSWSQLNSNHSTQLTHLNQLHSTQISSSELTQLNPSQLTLPHLISTHSTDSTQLMITHHNWTPFNSNHSWSQLRPYSLADFRSVLLSPLGHYFKSSWIYTFYTLSTNSLVVTRKNMQFFCILRSNMNNFY